MSMFYIERKKVGGLRELSYVWTMEATDLYANINFTNCISRRQR